MHYVRNFQNARINGLLFNQTVKLTIKVDSSLSNKNICPHLKLPIPIMLREFFGLISQNPEYVRGVCNDKITPFHFACRRWIINQ